MRLESETEDWTDEYGIGNCDHCDKKSCRIKVSIDPYLEEIHPDVANEESCWCWECYHETLWDI